MLYLIIGLFFCFFYIYFEWKSEDEIRFLTLFKSLFLVLIWPLFTVFLVFSFCIDLANKNPVIFKKKK